MITLKKQLDKIQELGHSVLEITKNYECGFISVNEMMGQIHEVHLAMGRIKVEICEEYGINQVAVDLMLHL